MQPERNVAPLPINITASTVSKAKSDAVPGGRRYDIVDAKSRGLSLRVSPTGVQWSLRFQINGSDKRLALGTVDMWTPAEARSLVDRAQAMLRDRMGIPDDVWLDRMRQREGKIEKATGAAEPSHVARQRFKWTFSEGRQAFLDEVKRTRRPGTFDDYNQKLRSADLIELEQRPLPQITRQELSAILAAIARSGRESTAEGLQRVLGRFWNWLAEDGQSGDSGVQPGIMTGLKAPERTLREVAGDDPWSDGYVPSLSEVGRVIAIARSGAVHQIVGAAIELACWTAQRRRSVSEARSADFEFISEEIGGLWHIPPISTKGGRIKKRPHVIPLPRAAWSVIERVRAMPAKDPESPWLFPQIRAKAKGMTKSHINGSSITHSLGWMPEIEATPHDLRRAFATHGEARLGLLRADTQSILDHSETTGVEIVMKRGSLSRGVTGQHYALHDGTHRTWSIMNAWAAALEPEIEKAIAALEPVEEIRAAMHVARYGPRSEA